MPAPVGQHWVDDACMRTQIQQCSCAVYLLSTRDEVAVDEVRDEVAALGQGAAHQRRGGRREGELEEELGQETRRHLGTDT